MIKQEKGKKAEMDFTSLVYKYVLIQKYKKNLEKLVKNSFIRKMQEAEMKKLQTHLKLMLQEFKGFEINTLKNIISKLKKLKKEQQPKGLYLDAINYFINTFKRHIKGKIN